MTTAKKKPARRAVTRSGPPPVTRAEFDALMADLRVVAKKMIEMATWFEDMSDIYGIAEGE